MESSKEPEIYFVAFSFAREQRHIVLPIAEVLKQKLGDGKVFYDEWFPHIVGGLDRTVMLGKIYREQSVLVIPCFSKDYSEKNWPRAEGKAIRQLEMKLDGSKVTNDLERILPLRVGDGELEDGTGAIPIDVREPRKPAEAAKIILDRLYLIRPELEPESSKIRKSLPENIRNHFSDDIWSGLYNAIRADLTNEIKTDPHAELKSQVIEQLKVELADEVKAGLRGKLTEEVKAQLKNDLTDGVRDWLRNTLAAEVKSQLRGDLTKEVRTQLKNDLADGVRSQLKDELAGEVKAELRDELRDVVRAGLRDELRDAVKAGLRDELRNEVKIRLRDELTGPVTADLKNELTAPVMAALQKELKDTLDGESLGQLINRVARKILVRDNKTSQNHLQK